MKKTYIQPDMKSVKLVCASIIAGSLNGDGVYMKINNTGAASDGDSRRGGSIWDDEEE
jgi:hypothetical protein